MGIAADATESGNGRYGNRARELVLREPANAELFG